MIFSKHLKEVALLGTSKKSIDPQQLPMPIQDSLHQGTFATPAEMLLDALSLEFYYQTAGTLPPKFTGTLLNDFAQEELPEAAQTWVKILHQILNANKHTQSFLLEYWVDMLLQQKKVVPSNAILKVIKLRSQQKRAFQRKIDPILGKKGQWIIQQYDVTTNYQKSKDETPSDQIWAFGTAKERKVYFEEYRQHSPAAALAELGTTWSEESIRDKLAFLKIIKATINKADEIFLTQLYQTEFAYQTSEKKLPKQARNILATALLSIPDTELQQNTIVALGNYVKKASKKGFFNKLLNQSSINIQIPTQEDAFFNPKNMVATYGFEAENTDIGQYRTAQEYWFAQLVTNLPIEIWEQLTGASTAQTVEYFLKNIAFQYKEKMAMKSYLQIPLYELAIQQSNQDLVKNLLQSKKYMMDAKLIAQLSPANWEAHIITHNLYLHREITNTWKAKNGSWSLDFSAKWLHAIFNFLKSNHYFPNHLLGVDAARFFPQEGLSILQKATQSAYLLKNFQQWEKHIDEPIKESLEIQLAIDRQSNKNQ